MAREATTLEAVEKQRAELRRLSTLKQNESTDVTVPSPREEGGKSRDKVAEKVGFKSGIEASRAIKTIQKIDELKKKGDTDSKDKADLLSVTLNRHSVSTAAELARYIDKVQILKVEITNIKEGKKSPYSYVEESRKN